MKVRGTPSVCIWAVIEAELRCRGMYKKELAKLIGIHYNTVIRDSSEPERIPQGRLWLYCKSLDIKPEDISRALRNSL